MLLSSYFFNHSIYCDWFSKSSLLEKKRKKKLIINGEAGGHCKNLQKIILYKSYSLALELKKKTVQHTYFVQIICCTFITNCL